MSAGPSTQVSGDSSAAASQLSLSEIRSGLETQARVINALILRETKTRYGEHKIGFLWALLEPIAMVSIFAFIMMAFRGTEIDGMPIIIFMITGFVPFTLFRETMGRLQGAIQSNLNLLNFPQVTVFDVVLARAILETVTTIAVFAVMLSMAYYFGFTFDIENPLGVLGVCFLLAMLGVGAGFLFSSLRPLVPSIQQITSALFGRPLLLSSGVFFTAESLPAAAREVLLYNPVLHMLELMRSEFFYEFESKYASWNYAISWSVAMMVMGLLCQKALRRRAMVGL